MDEQTISTEHGLAKVADGAVILTVNQRLARYLNQQYERNQLAADFQVWSTAKILPYGAWLNEFWLTHQTAIYPRESQAELLLTAFQASLLWKEVIGKHRDTYRSKCDEELSELAQKAWSSLNEWLIPEQELKGVLPENAALFKSWLMAYRQLCADSQWIDDAVLPTRVLTSLRSTEGLIKGETIIFAGFDEFSPRQLALIEALKQAGNTVMTMDYPRRGASLRKRLFADSASELTAAAVWAAELAKREPTASVGIIVPDLAAQRAQVLAEFTAVLHPSALVQHEESPLAFNITLGISLGEYPIIRAIFAALSLTNFPVRLEQVSAFLLDRYFVPHPEDNHRRAALDVALRDVGELWLNEQIIHNVLKREACNDRDPSLVHQFSLLREFANSARNKRFPSQWAEHVATLLRALGWAAGFRLSSEEYQQHVAWQRTLEQFAQLDSVAGVVTWGMALALLQKMTAQTVFQPEATPVPIHIMGLFETAGLSFDYLWLMGLQDDVLPAFPKPNPLLPIALQKKYAMPHSTSERELRYAQTLLERLSVCANEVIFSCAMQTDEVERRPSPLLGLPPGQQIWQSQSQAELKPARVPALIFASQQLERWRDETVALSAERCRVKGGVSIIKNQALCPFKAFAAARLNAEPIDEPGIGLTAIDRGNLLHGVLEDFWREVGAQARLLALPEAELEALLASIIDKRVRHLARKKIFTMTPRFINMECHRLKTHVLTWLHIEMARPAFSVLSVESAQELSIAGLSLATKMDRIDQLDDGAWLLIDYKTGRPYVKHWFGERPEEPQLPLYALCADGPVRGLAFAQLKTGEQSFKGLADCSGAPEGVKPFRESDYAFGDATWDDLLEEWRGKLHALADAFRQGVANVDPKDANACANCHYALLCRVTELDLLSFADVEDQETENSDA